MNNFLKLTLLMGLCISFLNLGGCNTMQGVGRDISCGGNAIARAAS